ncbi:hypothetical protein GCM10020331_031420 [Ectobacillus funiculus]
MVRLGGNIIMKNVFVYSDAFQTYRFSPEHPFNQLRVKLSYDLLQKKGGFIREEQIVVPRIATEEEIALIHDQNYIEAIKKGWRRETR